MRSGVDIKRSGVDISYYEHCTGSKQVLCRIWNYKTNIIIVWLWWSTFVVLIYTQIYSNSQLVFARFQLILNQDITWAFRSGPFRSGQKHRNYLIITPDVSSRQWFHLPCNEDPKAHILPKKKFFFREKKSF